MPRFNITGSAEVTIVIKMDLKDARWLQGVMQNPLHGQTPAEEDGHERTKRHQLFGELKAQTENWA